MRYKELKEARSARIKPGDIVVHIDAKTPIKGTVQRIIPANSGPVARVLWDNGSTSRHLLPMLKVVG